MINSPTPTALPTHPESSIIVAMTRDGIIGNRGNIPWDHPEDLRLFKQLTTGNTVIMGRRTYDSIGTPLPDRHNIVISRSLPAQQRVTVCPNFSESIAAALKIGRPFFFIGGTEVYREGLEIAEHLHISWIDGKFQGDTLFPSFDLDDWQLQSEQQYHDFRYGHYRRRVPAPDLQKNRVGGGISPPSSHTTVRTVPYTAVHKAR
jgi:dihydrofolate reductase